MCAETFYILHVVDCFTKYTWAKDFDTKEAQPVVDFLKELIREHGKPKIIQCDNGKEFLLLKGLCDEYVIILAHPLPYNAQADGQVRILSLFATTTQFIYNATHRSNE